MNTTFNLAENSKQVTNLKKEAVFTSCDIGSFDGIAGYISENKDFGLQIPSKLFLNKILGLTGAEISINKMPSGTDFTGNHKHRQNEEILIVLSGTGTILVDGKEIPAKEGTIARIKTGAVRAVKSIENLTYICIQVKENSLTGYTLTDAEML